MIIVWKDTAESDAASRLCLAVGLSHDGLVGKED